MLYTFTSAGSKDGSGLSEGTCLPLILILLNEKLHSFAVDPNSTKREASFSAFVVSGSSSRTDS